MESSTALLNAGPPLAASAEAAVTERPRRLNRRRLMQVAAVVVIAAAVGGLLYLRAWPPFATVMSASMSPAIDTGDVVVMKRIDGQPRVGDVISVSVPDEARSRYGYPPTVIHRVVRIGADGRITTKGDARREVDPFTVESSAVRAEVVTSIPAAGRVLAFLTSTMGLIWLAAGVLLLVVLPLVERHRELQRRGQDGIEELRGDIRELTDELARIQYEVGARNDAQAALDQALAGVPALIQAEMARAIEVAQAATETEPEPEPEPASEPEPVVAPHPSARETRAQSGILGRTGRRPGLRRWRN